MTRMKRFGQVQYLSQTLPMVCNLPTPVSPRRQWISAAASPTCCQGNKIGQKKIKKNPQLHSISDSQDTPENNFNSPMKEAEIGF